MRDNHWAWASLIAVLSVFFWSITYSLLPVSISNDSYGYLNFARELSRVMTTTLGGWSPSVIPGSVILLLAIVLIGAISALYVSFRSVGAGCLIAAGTVATVLLLCVFSDVAREFISVAPERTFGYPLLLTILGVNESDSVFRIIFFQSLLTISIPLLVYFALEEETLKVRVLCATLSCIYTYPYALSLSVLTESTYIFSLTLYGFFVCKYFKQPSTIMAAGVAICCIIIAFLRVSGLIYFIGFGLGVAMYWWYQYSDSEKLESPRRNYFIGRHVLVSLLIFGSYEIVNNLVSSRTSSIVWSHFAFNWSYRSPSEGNTYHGIIKPENGPNSAKLFQEVEAAIEANWIGAFDTLKTGGSDLVKSLEPNENNLYSKGDVEILMDDIINNNTNHVRSWKILAAVANCCVPSNGWAYSYSLAGKAVKEGLLANPMTVLDRLYLVVTGRILVPLVSGFHFNSVSLPSAYFHQVPTNLGGAIIPAKDIPIGPGMYKEWISELYEHSGSDPEAQVFGSELLYPTSFTNAAYNFDLGNITGTGHYFVEQTSQVLRLAWILIILGSFMIFFLRTPKLCCLIFVGVLSPVASVFISETDPRHLYMAGQLHLIIAGVVLGIIVRAVSKRKILQ